MAKPCVVNPKTGKPFTRHRYEQQNLHVEEYVTMRSGERAPVKYGGDLVCKREGCEHRVAFTY